MSVLDTKFVQGFIRMCNDGWEQGWHERNGGNLSYRIKDEEVAEVKEFLDYDNEWKPIGTKVPGLASEYFLVTGKPGNISAMSSLIRRIVSASSNWMKKERITASFGAW